MPRPKRKSLGVRPRTAVGGKAGAATRRKATRAKRNAPTPLTPEQKKKQAEKKASAAEAKRLRLFGKERGQWSTGEARRKAEAESTTRGRAVRRKKLGRVGVHFSGGRRVSGVQI